MCCTLNNYSKTLCIALTTSCKNRHIFKTYIRSAGKYLLPWHSFMKWCLQIKQISGQYIVATPIIVLICDNNHDVAFGINTTVNCFVATHHHYLCDTPQHYVVLWKHHIITLLSGNTTPLCNTLWCNMIHFHVNSHVLHICKIFTLLFYFIFTFKIWQPWSAYVFK